MENKYVKELKRLFNLSADYLVAFDEYMDKGETDLANSALKASNILNRKAKMFAKQHGLDYDHILYFEDWASAAEED